MKNVSDKSCTECQNTLSVRQAYFRKTCSLCVHDGKTAEPEAPQMAQHGACAFHAACLRLQTHTHNMLSYAYWTVHHLDI